ncbi:MAG: exosortase/archaeosortase family protein [Chthoniobacterales bacterium]
MKTKLLAAFAVLFPWVGLFIALWPTWHAGVYYGYGFLIPPLAFLLVYSRLSTPSADWKIPGRLPLWWWALGIAGLIVSAGCGIFECLDPLWRRTLWIHGGACLLLSALVVYALGGGRAVSSMTGCGIFLLTALPLPFFMESALVNQLTILVAHQAAEVLNLLGIAATATGTIVTGSRGFVAVDDTCSGLRTIQAGIMLALLFGEAYRLTGVRRIVLVVIALAASVLTNVVRVVCLAFKELAGTGGITASFHDTAGALSFMACVFIILFAAYKMMRSGEEKFIPLSDDAGRGLRCALLVGLIASVLPFLAAIGWFGFSQSMAAQGPVLTLPEAIPNRLLRIDPNKTNTSKILHYDRAQVARYVFGDHEWLDILVLDYGPANSRSWTELLVHGPEICMPALGLKSGKVLEKGRIQLNGEPWNLEKFTFVDPKTGRTIYIFRLTWWGGGELASQDHLRTRWEALMRHHRINWTTRLILGGVVLDNTDENHAYEVFISAVQDALKPPGSLKSN